MYIYIYNGLIYARKDVSCAVNTPVRNSGNDFDYVNNSLSSSNIICIYQHNMYQLHDVPCVSLRIVFGTIILKCI